LVRIWLSDVSQALVKQTELHSQGAQSRGKSSKSLRTGACGSPRERRLLDKRSSKSLGETVVNGRESEDELGNFAQQTQHKYQDTACTTNVREKIRVCPGRNFGVDLRVL